MRKRNVIVGSLLGVLMGFGPIGVSAAEPNGASQFFDLVVARPIGLAATVTGLGLAVGTSPVTVATGTANEAWKRLVKSPADATFKRPLGKF